MSYTKEQIEIVDKFLREPMAFLIANELQDLESFAKCLSLNSCYKDEVEQRRQHLHGVINDLFSVFVGGAKASASR